MSAVVRALHVGRLRSGPWQNHELAEFYRVIDVLGRAGLAVVPDMGVSDEGDPWFAFCHVETGEIIVHCARIDGAFVATSIALNEVFRGNEIRDVINAIMRSKHFALATAVGDKRLYLHPAAVFAAFIAAALLFSKQVSAHDLSAAGSETPSEGHHHHWGKFLSALKTAIADASSGSQSGANIGSAFSDGSQPGSPIPLAVLMSAAISLTVPVVGADDIGGGWGTGTAPLANPGDILSPAALSSPSLLSIADGSSAISSWDDSSWAVANATFGVTTTGLLPDAGSLTVSTGPAGTTGQTGGPSQPSFLADSGGSNDAPIHHFAVLPLHTDVPAVISEGTTVAQWVPAVHPYELSEISAAALAVFLGTTQPTTLADVSNTATILPPPPVPHDSSTSDSTPPTSAAVVTPTPDTTGSQTADAQPTGDSQPTTDGSSQPSTDSSLPQPASTTPTDTTTTGTTPADTTPADTTPTDTTSTDTTPAVVSPPPTDVPPSNVSTPPVDTQPTTPPSSADLPTVPAIIDMVANPIAGLGELLDYALTTHPINATFAVTSSLAAMLVSYTAQIGGPAHLVVFDSNNVWLPAFEFSNGVLFVDDHQLGITEAQAPAANLVTVDLASGAVMTLLGVVDTTHLTI